MQNLKILNKKETKRILELIKNQWGFEGELDYVFLMSTKNKIYLINKDIANIDTGKIRINSLGLYFAESKTHDIRLSIEGSQIIGQKATKNIIELDQAQARNWIKGNDLEMNSEVHGFAIMKHGKDFLGCGRVSGDKVLNFVPKARRLNVSD